MRGRVRQGGYLELDWVSGDRHLGYNLLMSELGWL